LAEPINFLQVIFSKFKTNFGPLAKVEATDCSCRWKKIYVTWSRTIDPEKDHCINKNDLFFFFFYNSSFEPVLHNHCQAARNLGAGIEQPFCFIVQNL